MGKKGVFIVIEGTDGTGKATQTNLLAKRLESQGRKVKLFDFPQYGKNTFARAVGNYLIGKFGKATEINPYLASFAYAGDRAKAAGEIRSFLEQGYIVLSNRYTSANMGHQGGKFKDEKERKEFFDWLKELEFSEDGYNVPKPDLTLILYLNPEIAQKLVDEKAKREYTQGQKRDGHEADIDHLKNTAEVFKKLAETEESWKLISCDERENNSVLPREQINEKIWEAIKDSLNC